MQYNHKVIGIVSMDLSKAFDTLPHDLMVLKLKQYQLDDKIVNLTKGYLSNRRQRVKLGNVHSTWQDITTGVPQGSILGPVPFNIFMNDLVYVIKLSNLSTYADDTQIFFADKDPLIVQETINSGLSYGMKRNHCKDQAMVMGYRNVNSEFCCENNIFLNSDALQMLGITVDDMLKFDKQGAKICRKVSRQVAVVKRMRNILPFEIRKNIYFSFVVPHFDYCAQTWHFCNKSSADKLEKVNERAVRSVF